jgi:Tol biopolymer transport system component
MRRRRDTERRAPGEGFRRRSGALAATLAVVVLGSAAAARAAVNDTDLVSRADGTSGAAANGNAVPITSVSADGRFVAFASAASNLSDADGDLVQDVFVRDLELGTTTLVSRVSGADGAGGDADSGWPSISGDGRYVAFESAAENLSGEDAPGTYDVYVRDLAVGSTTLVSRATGATGAAAAKEARHPSISSNGRYIAFDSLANNLATEDVDGTYDIFLRDVVSNTTTLESRATGAVGVAGDAHSNHPSVASSADGVRVWVAFTSTADNLSDEDDDAVSNVFVRDIHPRFKATFLVSRAEGQYGVGGNGDSLSASISNDARVVAFRSFAQNLDAATGAAPGVSQVYTRDVQANRTLLVSRENGPAGAPGDQYSYRPVVSGDGSYIAFKSAAENLSGDDTATIDVFVRDTIESRLALVSRASGVTGPGATGESGAPAISGDGRFVAFISEGDNLSTEDQDDVANVFRRELPPGLPPPPPPPVDLGDNTHGDHGTGGHGGGAAHTDGHGAAAGHGGMHAGGHKGSAGGHGAHSEGRGPRQTVTAAKRQRIGNILVTSTLHVPGRILVEGQVALSGRAARVYRFKKVTRKTPAHRLNIVRLRLGPRALRIINRALRRGERLKALITVTGIDRTGARNPVQRTIRLLPRRTGKR